jgi:hypothetical protein
MKSAIGRPLDPRYLSNRFILIAAPLSGLGWMVWKLLSEGDWGAAVGRALVAGMTTFLAWAIARELDPDRPWTAGVAAAVAAGTIGAGVPSLLVAATALMAIRIAARTTGWRPQFGDLVFMVGLAAVAGASDAGLAAGVVLGVVLLADRLLPGGAESYSMPMGAIALGAAVAAAAVWGVLEPAGGAPHGSEWAMVPIAIIGLLALGRPGSVSAKGDLSRKPLSVARVRIGRLVAVLAAGLTFAWAGGPGLTSGGIVWAALAASALPTLFSWPAND